MIANRSNKYREKLNTLSRRLKVTVTSLEEQVRTPTGGEAAGGISNTPLHLGDLGSDAQNQELGVTLLENESYLRDEVNAALDRLDKGTYGVCQQCRKRILAERLEALPYARWCAACAEANQSAHSK